MFSQHVILNPCIGSRERVLRDLVLSVKPQNKEDRGKALESRQLSSPRVDMLCTAETQALFAGLATLG